MLLERAAAEKAKLVCGGTDQRDRRYEQLLEKMRLMEKSFSLYLKEIDLWDKIMLELEGKLEGIKEENNLLRAQLEGLPGNSTDPTYTRGTSPGKRVWEELISPAGTAIRRSHTQVGFPILPYLSQSYPP